MAYDDLDAATQTRLRAVLALRPRGLLSDVDGTLSAIAPSPDVAVLLPGVADLLTSARASFDYVAAVSGRGAEDARRLVGVPGIAYIGNHGLESIESDGVTHHVLAEAEPYVKAINLTLAEIEAPLLEQHPGLLVERKGVTASIHVRATADPAAAEAAVYQRATQAAARHGLRVTLGKRVVELRPPIQANKGTAIAALVRVQGLRSAFYLGDDVTDIDAFRTLRQLTEAGTVRGVAVAVLQAEAPPDLAAAADITLPSIEHVPAFLQWLVVTAANLP